jgi:hypothetical protein
MHTSDWARVSSNPSVLKMHGNVLGSLVLNQDDLGKSSSSIKDSQRAEFKSTFGGMNFPWANKVHGYFFSRKTNVLAWGQVSLAWAWVLVVLA